MFRSPSSIVKESHVSVGNAGFLVQGTELQGLVARIDLKVVEVGRNAEPVEQLAGDGGRTRVEGRGSGARGACGRGAP